jgi:hypothetical protein
MANELSLKYTLTGQTIKGIVWGQNRATRWNNAAMVAPSTISDANWAVGMVALTEQQTSDTTATATYVGSFPAGIVAAGEYLIEYYIGASPLPGDAVVGIQSVEWTGAAGLVPTIMATEAKQDTAQVSLDAIALDVAGLDGAAMRGTDNAYTGTPPTADAIGTDAASKILATPANKLVTDASGGVGLTDGTITDAKFTVPTLTGPATGPVGYLHQTWRRFFKKATKTSTAITTYADNGTTAVTTQVISTSGTTENQGAAT